MELTELRAKDIRSLREVGGELKIRNAQHLKKEDLLRAIMEYFSRAGDLHFAQGVLEILPDGYGFLRSGNCLPERTDIYVSPSQIKRFGLRNGDLVGGDIRVPKNDERYFALLKVKQVNY